MLLVIQIFAFPVLVSFSLWYFSWYFHLKHAFYKLYLLFMQIRLHAKNKGKFIHKPNLPKTDTIHKVFYDFIPSPCWASKFKFIAFLHILHNPGIILQWKICILNIYSFNNDVFESHKCYFCIADTRPLHSEQLGCGVSSFFIQIYWCFCKERNLIFWDTNLVSLLKIREAYVFYWTIMILYNSSTYFLNPLYNQVSWKLHNLTNNATP